MGSEKISERQVVAGLRVQHRARGTFYRVEHLSTFQGAQAYDDEVVVTYSGRDGRRYTRPLSEFCDGRFAAIGICR